MPSSGPRTGRTGCPGDTHATKKRVSRQIGIRRGRGSLLFAPPVSKRSDAFPAEWRLPVTVRTKPMC